MLILSSAAQATAHTPAAVSVADRLSGYLSGLDNLSADFSQSVLEADSNIEIERASGRVQLSKPGRFRWDYAEPYRRVIVADGEQLWFYEEDLEQVTVRELSAGLGDTPAALLTGDTAALEQFEVLDNWQASGLDWLRLAPKSAEADFALIEIGFDGPELSAIEFVDQLGQRTRILLSNIQRPDQFSADPFVFEIPDGVDVIGAGDL